MPNTAPQAPPEVTLEGTAPRNLGGRPPKRPPMSSILRILRGVEDTARETGDYDPSLARKLLAGYAVITLERALLADDRDIPLKMRADMALRVGPIVAMLDTLIDKNQEKKYPATESAVDKEIEARLGRFNKLLTKKVDIPVEVMLDTLAPATAVPPVEA